RTRSVAALVAAAAFAIPIFLSLGTTVPPIRRVPLGVEERIGGFPADLRGRWSVEPDGIFYLLRIGLRATDPARLLAYRELGLEILTYAGPLDLADARLALEDTACAYRTKTGFAMPTDGVLTLERGTGCSQADASSAGAMVLTLRLRREGHAALRAAVRPDVTSGAVVISPFGLETPPGVLMARGTLGDLVSGRSAATRLALLAYVWNLSSSGAWIVVVLLAAAAAIAGAVFLAERPAAAAFLAALALSAAYAVLVPPFQAADEPNHFLTLAGTLERPDLAEAAEAWARRAHFEELRAPGRPFTPADVDSPGQPWVGVQAPDTMR